MELLDIVDENGEPTGEVRPREEVHRKGYLHRTSHVWIVRKNNKSGLDVLLQKRSANKDSHPGCYDISSAGHIPAGDEFIDSAIRELKEELGITASKNELTEYLVRRIHSSNTFHGKLFIDNQVTHVYYLIRNDLKLTDLSLQKEEIESAMWMDLKECISAVKNNTIPNCICLQELEGVQLATSAFIN